MASCPFAASKQGTGAELPADESVKEAYPGKKKN